MNDNRKRKVIYLTVKETTHLYIKEEFHIDLFDFELHNRILTNYLSSNDFDGVVSNPYPLGLQTPMPNRHSSYEM